MPPTTTPSSTTAAFRDGVGSFFEGLSFLAKNPRLAPLVVLPFCISLVVFAALLWVSWIYYGDFKDWLMGAEREGFWWGLADVALNLVLIVVFYFVACFPFFVTVTSLITSPFSEYLSQQVEKAFDCPGRNLVGGGRTAFVTDALRGLKHECIRTSIFVVLWLCCLPLLLIPLAYPIAMGFISIRWLAWDGVDYSLSRRGLSFRDKTAYLRARRARTVGFGAISFAALAIPLTSVFVLPLNAIGGTILFCKMTQEEGEPRRSAG